MLGVFLPATCAAMRALACGSPEREEGTQGGSPGGQDGDGGTGTGAGGDGAGNDGDGDDDGGVLYDVGDGTGTGEDDGCKKIDFLFVVDNSGSMLPHQQKLIAAFPQFIATIQEQVEGDDYHIMVVDSDDDPTFACEPDVHNGDPEWERVCRPAVEPHCWDPCPTVPNYCVGYGCGDNQSELDAGDKKLGCGVVRPHGGSASNQTCPIDGGLRYMTHAQNDLSGTFACAARVGTSGHWNEAPVRSILEVLSPELNGPGGCNEGFLRDDAVLVVVFVSDDDDESSAAPADVVYGSNGTPQEWHDALIAAKGGHPENVVMLGIVCTEEFVNNPGCNHGNGLYLSPKFVEFIELFGDLGLVGDVCDSDYGALFDQAVALVDQSCDEFVPPG
jgi:hypothetical protein